MRIGVVSDTHNRLRNVRRIVELGALVFNPGECAGWLPDHNTVGVLELASLEVEWLRF